MSKFRKIEKISTLLFYVLHKTRIFFFFRHFHVVVVQKQLKKCTNKRDIVFCLFVCLFFWRSRCRSRLWILRSLMSKRGGSARKGYFYQASGIWERKGYGSLSFRSAKGPKRETLSAESFFRLLDFGVLEKDSVTKIFVDQAQHLGRI